MTLTYACPRLLSRNAVKLGRFVVNLESPELGFHDSPALQLESHDIFEKPQASLQDRWSGAGSTKVYVRMVALLKTLLEGNHNREGLLASATITTYQLANSSDKFEVMCNNMDTRKWLEKVVARGLPAYMIVGFETVQGGTLSQDSSYGAGASADVHIPATNTTLDPAVGFGVSGSSGRGNSVEILGEQVCTVQYRKIQFKWYKSKDLENASLQQGARWKLYYGTRDEEDSEDEQEIEDVIGAELVDLDVASRDWDIVTDEPGEQIFLSRSPHVSPVKSHEASTM